MTNHIFLHPSMNRWHALTKYQNNTDDDASRNEFKHFNNNELFLHRLTTTSPAESIVSAPLTPTGNLIVNILGNLDNQPTDTNNLNRKNYRNSTNCIIDRNAVAFDDSNPTVSNLNKIASVTLAERRLNGQTKSIPITTTSIANGTVQYVTIAINDNDGNGLSSNKIYDDNTIKTNLFCNRSYNLSSSAPQFINCWNG